MHKQTNKNNLMTKTMQCSPVHNDDTIAAAAIMKKFYRLYIARIGALQKELGISQECNGFWIGAVLCDCVGSLLAYENSR
jgi:hypothetical protein